MRPPYDLVVHNWPLKVAAVALSAILWMYVSSEEATSQLVGVQLDIEPPQGLALAKPVPAVRALVSGPGRELIKLYASPLVVRIALPATAAPPRHRLTITPADIQVPRNANVTIQDVEPRVMDLELDRLVRREVPVALRGVVQPESGFVVAGRVALTPSTVRVTGPRGLVAALDSFPTEPIEIRGVTGDFERVVPLDTAGRTLLRVAPREVTVSGRARRS